MIVSMPVHSHAPPPMQLAVEFYVARRSGGFFVFDNTGRGSHSRMVSQVSSGTVPIFIDPLSAIWMGLVTPEQLGISETSVAVMKLAMQDIL